MFWIFSEDSFPWPGYVWLSGSPEPIPTIALIEATCVEIDQPHADTESIDMAFADAEDISQPLSDDESITMSYADGEVIDQPYVSSETILNEDVLAGCH